MCEPWNRGGVMSEDSIVGRRLWLLVLLELAVAVGIVGYWTCFYSVGAPSLICAHLGDGYLMYERAFPVADCLLCLALILGVIGLLRRRAFGLILSIAAGGALVFLGVLDATFNLTNGVYALGICEGVVNALMNLACVASGMVLLWLPVRWGRTVSS